MWIENSTMILKAAEELLGKTSGRGPPNEKESWWWSLNTQDKIKRKRKQGEHTTEMSLKRTG